MAVSGGHMEVFDLLCRLAQAGDCTDLSEEFKLQRLRCIECSKNMDARHYGDRPTEVAATDSAVGF